MNGKKDYHQGHKGHEGRHKGKKTGDFSRE
jgi:hypothetical protein